MTTMAGRTAGRARPGPPPAPRAALIALATVATLAGCDRAPRLVPAPADSTAALPADSTALYVQWARAGWESPEDAGEAARLTSRLLLDHLRAHPGESLGAVAREFVDSLGLGAEVAGRNPAVVNLFARSDPSGGSWPFVFWRDGGAARSQLLEAGGMHLDGVGVEPAAPGEGSKAQRIAVLFSGLGPTGQQPFAFVWRRPPEGASWNLAQSLGADSLGRTGTARVLEGAADGAVLETRTHSVERGFEECPSCPHITRTRRFRWSDAGLTMAGEVVERSPYATFVQLVRALLAGDRETAERLVADGSLLSAADGYEWGRPKGLWRLAPGAAANTSELVVFRGAHEAYRIHFAPRSDDWVVSGFEPTSRSVE